MSSPLHHPEPTMEAGRCLVPPSPDLLDRLREQRASLADGMDADSSASIIVRTEPRRVGLNDGLILPGDAFPLGTPAQVVRSAAAMRAPLRGTLNVAVVLVQFSDRTMSQTAQHFRDLFFSTGVLPDGSVKEYFTEASHGLVTIGGTVVGPYTMPRTLAAYAAGQSGTGNTAVNARDMARDALLAADPDINLASYDNDGDGFVDAFVVVHAGPGGEVTGAGGDIWSHKWVFKGGAAAVDGTQVYGYLTVPEDARIGVCSHELGHLLFGWPDLYDTDGSSEGVGNWCLMGGGSWLGGGDVPAHPSAWCKTQQGWASVVTPTGNALTSFPDVKTGHRVWRLWKDGGGGSEYFLVENRQKTGYDRLLPGPGLLVWHIDDAIGSNSDEAHPKVALAQADGLGDLNAARNRGDAGDSWPGSAGATSFTAATTPSSRSYAGVDTCVALTDISAPAATMTAMVAVRCGKVSKEFLGDKGHAKETAKDVVVDKSVRVDKSLRSDKGRLGDKARGVDKLPEKPIIDKGVGLDKNPVTEGKIREKLVDGKLVDGKLVDGKLSEGGFPGGGRRVGDEGRSSDDVRGLEARLSALEQLLSGLLAGGGDGTTEPFIGQGLRPDLRGGALQGEEDAEGALARRVQTGDAVAKRLFDTPDPGVW